MPLAFFAPLFGVDVPPAGSDAAGLGSIIQYLGPPGGVVVIVWWFLSYLGKRDEAKTRADEATLARVDLIQKDAQAATRDIADGFVKSVEVFRGEMRVVIDRLLTIAEKSASSEAQLASRVAELATQITGLAAATASVPTIIQSLRDQIHAMAERLGVVPEKIEEILDKIESDDHVKPARRSPAKG